MEREFKATQEKDEFAGIRTHPLVAILGFITVVLSKSMTNDLLIAMFPAMVLLVGITYYVRSMKGHLGLSSEIGLLIAFSLGCLSGLDMIREALAAAVITTTLLSLKGEFKAIITRLSQDEIYAFIKFIILSMLVLPFLPDQDYGPGGILNPANIGRVVVIISTLNFISYFLIKFRGSQKGILMTSILGGLSSSTAITWVFSSRGEDADQRHIRAYSAGIILASSIMFLRVTVVTAIFNTALFQAILAPCLLMAITGIAGAWLTLRKQKETETSDTEIKLGNPVNILNAMIFGLVYIAISLLVYYANQGLGDKGLYLSGAVSGLADVDAITISIARMELSPLSIPLTVIILAMLSNSLVKWIIVLVKGSPGMRKQVSYSIAAMLAVGVLYAVFLIS